MGGGVPFLERLRSHVGGLIRIRGQLYWYDEGRWDGKPGRVCLVIGVTTALNAAAAQTRQAAGASPTSTTVALLLIDGSPQWVWVAEADVEIIS